MVICQISVTQSITEGIDCIAVVKSRCFAQIVTFNVCSHVIVCNVHLLHVLLRIPSNWKTTTCIDLINFMTVSFHRFKSYQIKTSRKKKTSMHSKVQKANFKLFRHMFCLQESNTRELCIDEIQTLPGLCFPKMILAIAYPPPCPGYPVHKIPEILSECFSNLHQWHLLT